MKREVIWTWAAEVDAQKAFERLENTSTDAGVALVGITDRLLTLLQSFPFLSPMWHPPIRRGILRRLHYGLFYTVEASRIVVIGLQDLRQDPDLLQRELTRRLPGAAG